MSRVGRNWLNNAAFTPEIAINPTKLIAAKLNLPGMLIFRIQVNSGRRNLFQTI